MASTKPCLFERRWPGVIQTPISINSNIITITDAFGLHPKQRITLTNGSDKLIVEIKRVISTTQLSVIAYENKKVLTQDKFESMIAPFNGGTLTAPEQERNKIGGDVALKNAYAEEPTVAIRTNLVDYWGCQYATDNPLPVQLTDGEINIGVVEANIEVQLSHLDDWPKPGRIHDSIRIGNGDYIADVDSDNQLKVTGSFTDEEKIVSAIKCADDVLTDYTWAEIDGVRRVIKTEWSSANVTAELGVTSAEVVKDYVYQALDPFDLDYSQQELVVVP